MEESTDYEVVKEAVLKTVEQDPEMYWRRFRDIRKTHSQTYLEVARECNMKLQRWLKSQKIEIVEELKLLIVLEHFKSLANPHVIYEICKYKVKICWRLPGLLTPCRCLTNYIWNTVIFPFPRPPFFLLHLMHWQIWYSGLLLFAGVR